MPPPTPTVGPILWAAPPTPSTKIIAQWAYYDTGGNVPAGTTFNIKRCSGASCSPTSLATGVTTQFHASTGLTANTVYGFSYSITDGTGTSGDSPITYVTTTATNDHVVHLPVGGFSVIYPSLTENAGGTPQTWSPFSWYDTTQTTIGEYHALQVPVHGPGALTGTVAVTNGNTTVTGTGTFFLEEVNTADAAVPMAHPYHHLFVNVSGSLVDAGVVSSIASNTSLTLVTPWAGSTLSGRAAGTSNPSNEEDQFIFNGTLYYDLALTLYAAYWRTGDTAFLVHARKVADSWYSGAGRQGRTRTFDSTIWGPPRGFSMAGLMVRALDGRPEMWDSIYEVIDAYYAGWIIAKRGNSQLVFMREQAYMLYYGNLLQQLLPNSYKQSDGTTTSAGSATTVSDGATKRATYKTNLETDIPLFESWQEAYGAYLTYDCTIGASYGSWECHVDQFQTDLGGLLFDALGMSAQNPNLDTTTQESARKQTLRGATYLGLVAYNNLRVNNSSPLVNWRNIKYFSDGGNVPNPDFYRYLSINDTFLEIDGFTIASNRQNNTLALAAFAHAYSLSGVSLFKTIGDEVLNSTFAEIGEDTGATGDGKKSFAAITSQPKLYNQAYRISGTYLGRRNESPSLLATPPTNSAGSDVVLTGNTNSVTLSGSSSGGTGSRNEFWTFVKFPQTIHPHPWIKDRETNSPTLCGMEPGTYIVRHITFDSLGIPVYDDAQITVGGGTFLPTVVAGDTGYNAVILNASGTTSVTLKATAASEGASETFAYSWALTKKPKNGATPTITSPSSNQTTITSLYDGDFLFRARATGNTSGLVRDVYVPVTIHRASNAQPTSTNNAVPIVVMVDQTLSAGMTATQIIAAVLDAEDYNIYSGAPGAGFQDTGSGSIRDAGTWSWSQTAGPVSATITGGTTIKPVITGLTQAGTYTFEAVYSDGLDNGTNPTGGVSSVNITVPGDAQASSITGKVSMSGKVTFV